MRFKIRSLHKRKKTLRKEQKMRKIKALAGVAAALILGTTASADTAEKIMKDGEPYYRFTVEDWNEVWDVPEQMMTVYDLTGDSSVTTQEITAQAYQITGLTFEDADGYTVDRMQPGGKIKDLKIKTLVNNAPSAVAMVAIYQNGVVTGVQKINIYSGALGIEETYPIRLPLGSDLQGMKVKVFLFDSLTTLRPMTNPFVKDTGRNRLTVKGHAGNKFSLLFSVSAEDQGKTFTLTYDPSKITLQSGYEGVIQVIENTGGTLRFTLSQPSVSLPFQFNSEYNGSAELRLSCCEGGAS